MKSRFSSYKKENGVYSVFQKEKYKDSKLLLYKKIDRKFSEKICLYFQKTLSDKAGQMSPEERQNHLRQVNTDKVVCYCRPCYQEINASGKHGVHMLELLFPEQLRLAL